MLKSFFIVLTALYHITPTVALVPSYPENTLCVFTNAARFDMKQYASKYPGTTGGALTCNNKPGMGPVYVETGLENAAKAHSRDMIDGNCFGHNTCSPHLCSHYGDCGFVKRISHYFPKNAGLGENVAAGVLFGNPEIVMSAWMNSQTHCSNMGVEQYNRVGLSFQSAGIKGTFVTQDFGIVSNPEPANPIVCGGFLPKVDGQAAFIAAIDTPNTDIEVRLVVNGVMGVLKLDVGTATRGTYRIDVSGLRMDSCNQYKFELAQLSTGKILSRYPETGFMQTNQMGNCQEGFSSAKNL